ncbi:MAG: hypothetical protein ABI833_03220 [Acidobacteriota bacterium]
MPPRPISGTCASDWISMWGNADSRSMSSWERMTRSPDINTEARWLFVGGRLEAFFYDSWIIRKIERVKVQLDLADLLVTPKA